MKCPELYTQRLKIRAITALDINALYEIFSDPEVMRYWSSPALQHLSEAEELYQRIDDAYQTDGMMQLGIERQDTQQLIGTCTLHNRHVPSRRSELGYALGSLHWHQGLMHEALTAFLTFAFDTLDLNRLEADIDPANLSSARTLERLGFQKEGYAHERWIVNGVLFDTAWYGLLAKNWRARANTAPLLNIVDGAP